MRRHNILLLAGISTFLITNHQNKFIKFNKIYGYILSILLTGTGLYLWMKLPKLQPPSGPGPEFNFIPPPLVSNTNPTPGYTDLGVPISIDVPMPHAIWSGSTPSHGYYPTNEDQLAISKAANIPANWALVGGYNGPMTNSVSASVSQYLGTSPLSTLTGDQIASLQGSSSSITGQSFGRY